MLPDASFTGAGNFFCLTQRHMVVLQTGTFSRIEGMRMKPVAGRLAGAGLGPGEVAGAGLLVHVAMFLVSVVTVLNVATL